MIISINNDTKLGNIRTLLIICFKDVFDNLGLRNTTYQEKKNLSENNVRESSVSRK